MKIRAFATIAALLASGGAMPTAGPLGCKESAADWISEKWDAVVVGAGTAGIIVADRLSEGGKKTLLLELGGSSYGITDGTERPHWLDGTNLSRVDVPGLYKSIFSGSTNLTCSQDVVNAFQGCTIGGTSAINAGLYFQPPASDWDKYHPNGWHSPDVQGAIKKLLARQPSVTRYSEDGKFYLQSGYEAARKWIVDGAGFANVSLNDDPDHKDKVFGRPAYNYIHGQRGGPARTYLQSALKRSNFRLATGARVRHINRVGADATGVLVEMNGASHNISLAPKGRVVLSAGALMSPQLLMVSGIGPEDVLKNLSAASVGAHTSPSERIVNAEVGNGLFDNPNTFIELSAPAIRSYTHNYTDPVPGDRNLYLDKRSGPYTFASQTAAFFAYVPQSGEPGRTIGVQGTVDSSGYGDWARDNHTITLNIYGTSGLYSSGRVLLSGDGKFTPGPSNDVYYADPRDGRAIAGFIHKIFQALPPSSAKESDGLRPRNIARDATVDEIYKYITTRSPYAVGSVQHWSSSCRVGRCVDVDTRVQGTHNIHVVDASIVAPLSVNPQFGVMVAAEKGAERLLAVWG